MAILNYKGFVDKFNKKLKDIIVDSGLIELDEQGFQSVNKDKMMYRARFKNPLVAKWQELSPDRQIKNLVHKYTPRHMKESSNSFKTLFNSLVAPKHLVDANVQHAQDLEQQRFEELRQNPQSARGLGSENLEQQEQLARGRNAEAIKRQKEQKLQDAYETVAKHMGVDAETVKNVFEDQNYNQHLDKADKDAETPAKTTGVESTLSKKFVDEFNQAYTPDGQTNMNNIINDDVLVTDPITHDKKVDWNKVNQNLDIAQGKEPRPDKQIGNHPDQFKDARQALNSYLDKQYPDLNRGDMGGYSETLLYDIQTSRAVTQMTNNTNPNPDHYDKIIDDLDNVNNARTHAKMRNELDRSTGITRASRANVEIRNAINPHFAEEDTEQLKSLLNHPLDLKHGETMGKRFQEIHNLTYGDNKPVDQHAINLSAKISGYQNEMTPITFIRSNASQIDDFETDFNKVDNLKTFTPDDVDKIVNQYPDRQKTREARKHNINPNNLNNENLDLYVDSMRPTRYRDKNGMVQKGVLIQAKKRGDIEGQASKFDGDYITNRKLPNGKVSHSQLISYDSALKILQANGIRSSENDLDSSASKHVDYGKLMTKQDKPMTFTVNVFSPDDSRQNDYSFNPNPDKIQKSEKPLGTFTMRHVEQMHDQMVENQNTLKNRFMNHFAKDKSADEGLEL